MFCMKCGKEVKTDWIRCPYCGNSLKEGLEFDDNGVVHNGGADSGRENNFTYRNSEAGGFGEEMYDNRPPYMDNSGVQNEKKGPLELIVRIAALISIICFFVPFASVSCAGQKIDISQIQLVKGDETVGDGSFWILLFLVLPIVVLIISFIKTMSLAAKTIISVIGGAAEIFWLIYLQVRLKNLCSEMYADVSFSLFYWLDLIGWLLIAGIYIYQVFSESGRKK